MLGSGVKGMFIQLNRSPFDLGRDLGRSAAAVLAGRFRQGRQSWKASGASDQATEARIATFARRIERVAPHWLEEAAGIAKGAGGTLEDVLRINCAPPGEGTSERHSCTSFACITPQRNALFKIRDERNHIQQFGILQMPGRGRIQIGRDIGNLGIAHFFNEHALAGANNTGSHTDHVPDEPLLNDCHLMRYFGENARGIGDIPALIERLLEAGLVGGAGPGRGMIFLFVDRERGLLLECHHADYAIQWIDGGSFVSSNHFLTDKGQGWNSKAPDKNTCLRRLRMQQLLDKSGSSPPPPAAVLALSRDRKSLPHALCNDDRAHFWMTISAQYQVIDRRRPEDSINYICCGNTRNSVYLPVPLSADQTFLLHWNGEFYREADRLYRHRGCGRHLQAIQRRIEAQTVDGGDYHRLCEQAFAALSEAAGSIPEEPERAESLSNSEAAGVRRQIRPSLEADVTTA